MRGGNEIKEREIVVFKELNNSLSVLKGALARTVVVQTRADALKVVKYFEDRLGLYFLFF